jgi:hypothetical protein
LAAQVHAAAAKSINSASAAAPVGHDSWIKIYHLALT